MLCGVITKVLDNLEQFYAFAMQNISDFATYINPERIDF